MYHIVWNSVFLIFLTSLVICKGENIKVNDKNNLKTDAAYKYAGREDKHVTGSSHHCRAACPSCPDRDPALFDNNGDITGLDGSSIIPASCPEHRYFISNCGQSWFDAYEKCCKLGMSLVSLTTALDYTCLNEAVAVINGSWWTSGTDVGCPVKHRKNFSWCSESPRRFFGEEGWGKKEPDMDAEDNCVRAGKQGTENFLADEPCSNMYNFACKGPAVDENCIPDCPTCPDKEVSLFDAIGNIKDKNDYGFWFTTANNKVEYLVSTTDLLPWHDAIVQCCMLGMRLVSFANEAQREYFFTNVAVESYTEGVWTSATDENCASTNLKIFKWCGTDTIMPESSYTWFYPGDPNNYQNNEKCVATYNYIDDSSAEHMYLQDENCANVMAYACEGEVNTNCQDTCQPFDCPPVNPLNFGPDGYIISHGVHYKITGCSKEFYISGATFTYDIAYARCCEFGMRLLSIVTMDVFDCLIGTGGSYMGGDFHWTSASSLNCEVGGANYFIWCTSPMRDVLDLPATSWAPNEPNFANADKTCVRFKKNPDLTIAMETYSCAMPAYIVCEKDV